MAAELDNASDLLATASTDAATHGDRLSTLATQLSEMASGEKHADHGGLARIQAALDQIQPDVSDEVAATIEQARDEISDYREGIEGV